MSEGCGAGCGCSAHKKTESKATESKKVVAQNGKGDAPRNISAKFRRNYDAIKWS
jgi:hypothetical protein